MPKACVVIPAHLADELADECTEMTAFEDFVTERSLARHRSIIGLYPATDESDPADFDGMAEAKGTVSGSDPERLTWADEEPATHQAGAASTTPSAA